MKLSHVDVAIVGGSNAGLSAALTLGRSRRRVAVIDDAAPRNAPASHAHNVYTRDGTPPEELRRIGREQLKPYDVHVVNNRVHQAEGEKGAFRLTLQSGEQFSAARLLLATGVSDDLPEVPGLLELWGKSVFACPYCHGWEVRDAPLAVVGAGDTGYHYARLIRHWSRDLVMVAGENPTLTDEQRTDLRARGVSVLDANVTRFGRHDGELSALHLSDGQRITRQAVFMGATLSLRGNLHAQLGCTLSDDGTQVVVDETGQTSVPGVYAAGDMVSPVHAVVLAAASGMQAGAMLNHGLIMETPST